MRLLSPMVNSQWSGMIVSPFMDSVGLMWVPSFISRPDILAQVLALESNYRSAGHIIELAEMSIAHNRHQRPVELKAVRSSGRPPVFCSVPDDDVQAEYVRERVEALLDYGVPPNEIAVLYRTHRQAQRLECALSAARIPYSVRSGQRFVEKPHVRRCLQFLSILADHQNVAQMAEGLEIFQGIGPVTANRLAARLTQRGWSGWITPDLMLEEPSLVARQASIEALGQCMRHLRELADQSLEAVVRARLNGWLDLGFTGNIQMMRRPDSMNAPN